MTMAPLTGFLVHHARSFRLVEQFISDIAFVYFEHFCLDILTVLLYNQVLSRSRHRTYDQQRQDEK